MLRYPNLCIPITPMYHAAPIRRFAGPVTAGIPIGRPVPVARPNKIMGPPMTTVKLKELLAEISSILHN